eukprot:4502293-Lingulodinium_polyedra.AAC.1
MLQIGEDAILLHGRGSVGAATCHRPDCLSDVFCLILVAPRLLLNGGWGDKTSYQRPNHSRHSRN